MKVKFFTIDSLISGLINGFINGGIAFSHMNKGDVIPISVDQISSTQQTVMGQVVSMSFILGIIFTLITSKIFAKKVIQKNPEFADLVRRPIIPDVLLMAVNNAIFMFGYLVIAAILWQRFVGVIVLDRFSGSFLIGIFAGLITMIVAYRTEIALLRKR